MWKDWFFFSRSQKIGILALIVIILALLVAKMVISFLPAHTTPKDNFESEARIFLDSLRKTSFKSNYQTHYRNYTYDKQEYSHEKLPVAVLSRFNPNTADSLQFVKLGIKPKIASNILKYRRKGGKFRTAEDFKKIWGIPAEQMQRLLAYVDIPAEVLPPQSVTHPRIAKTENIIELNSADTTQLQQVKGIGAGFARRIVSYRKRLGGFVKTDQLREVWGITPELYNAIASHFSINSKLIQSININRASIEKLKYHPYLNFYKAKAIYELRLTKGALKSIDDLKSLSILDKETLMKIEPYLSFQ
jgi:DNA uptake protein ComE-like DNA-binding protein